MRWWCAVAICAVAVAGAGALRADEEDDTAAFALSVDAGVEGGGARCAGALVALRAALTSARCARAPDLWVRAPHAASAVQVLRVAVADMHLEGGSVAGAEGEWVWGGIGADLALLELAASVGGARPILAAAGGECAPRAACYVPRGRARRMRVVPVALEPPVRCVARGARWPSPLQERALCVLGSHLCRADWGAALVCGGKLCGVLSRSAQSEEHDERDEDEAGAGATTAPLNETQCGDTHAAVSVPRAHRFMRCAMLRGACGRGECERVCAERWLQREPATLRPRVPAHLAPIPTPPAPPATSATPVPSASPVLTEDGPDSSTGGGAGAGGDAGGGGGAGGDAGEGEDDGGGDVWRARTTSPAAVEAETRARSTAAQADTDADDTTPTHTAATPSASTEARTAGPAADTGGAAVRAAAYAEAEAEAGETAGPPAAPVPAGAAGPATAMRMHGFGAFEFEPNRPDFKMTPARTTAVCLKAGEYGDNAAEYGAAEEAAGAGAGAGAASVARAPPAPTRSSPQPRAPPQPEMEARVSPAPPATPASSAPPAGRPTSAAPSRARPRWPPLLLPLAAACRLLCSK